MARSKTYSEKRSFDETPEPAASFEGNVDPGEARPGPTFMIHQHHARRLHYDLRLEMMNGDTPVLVSWAVPKNLPIKKGKPNLAVHVEDHPFEYGEFSGTIPEGNYGAGEVRIFDHGTYEVLEQEPGKLTFRLNGERLQGVWHLFRTRQKEEGKDDWLVLLRSWDGAEPDPLPPLKPMMATLVQEAFDNDAWIFEPKWDGVRALTTCTRDETVLVSRKGNDMTQTYPELAGLHDRLVALDAVVDGEIVAMQEGRPSFELLQSRINLQNPRDVSKAMQQIPVIFIAFDLLYLDGRSLVTVPIETRKELLSEIVVPSGIVQVSPHIPGEGEALFQAACDQELEGIVAKKLGSPYRAGRRTRDWLKIKTSHDADLVIGGWTKGDGSRSGSFGSVLVGAYDDDGLRFVGAVGTGFSEKVLESVYKQLEDGEIDECPFTGDPREAPSSRFGKPIRDPRWVDPKLVARIEFRELTSVGRLRAPSFKGLVPDRPPEEVRFDDLVPKKAPAS